MGLCHGQKQLWLSTCLLLDSAVLVRFFWSYLGILKKTNPSFVCAIVADVCCRLIGGLVQDSGIL